MARSSERVQELLAERLAQQDADREVIGGIIDRYTQLPPKEDEDYDISGIPEAEEGVTTPLLSPFAPLKAKQTKAPESTYGEQFYRFTGGFDGDAVTTERPLISYKPGEYDYKAGEPPIITGISDLLKFGDRALFGTPEEKAEVKKQTQEFIRGLPQILPDLMKSTIKSAQNIEAGGITTKDEDTGQITRPTEFLSNMGPTLAGIGAGTSRSIARTAGDDGQVLGIIGGRKMKSAPSKLEQLKEFETKAAKKGLRPLRPTGVEGRGEGSFQRSSEQADYREFYASFWNDQKEAGDDLRVFRSFIDEMPAIEINSSRSRLKSRGPMLDESLMRADLYYTGPKKLGKPKLTLDQVLSFPKLFEEYPHLKNTTIRYNPDMDKNIGASYSPENNEITLGAGYKTWLNFQKPETMGREIPEPNSEAEVAFNELRKRTNDSLLGTILHETQHAIDTFERRDAGTNWLSFLDPEEKKFLGGSNDDRFKTPEQFKSQIFKSSDAIGQFLKKEYAYPAYLSSRDAGRDLKMFKDELVADPEGFSEKLKGMFFDEEFMLPHYHKFGSKGVDANTFAFIDYLLRQRIPEFAKMEKVDPEVIRKSPVDYLRLSGIDVDNPKKIDSVFENITRAIRHMTESQGVKPRLREMDIAQRSMFIQNLLLRKGQEYYAREGGEMRARLADLLRTGDSKEQTYAESFETPTFGQQRNLDDIDLDPSVGRDYPEHVLHRLEESFREQLSPSEARKESGGPNDPRNLFSRRSFTWPLEMAEYRKGVRNVYPEYLYDVSPADVIYPIDPDTYARRKTGSRNKTQRELHAFPKVKKAQGGPVNNRVAELLDATFRK